MNDFFCKKWTYCGKKGAIIFFEESYRLQLLLMRLKDCAKEKEVNIFVCCEFLGGCVSDVFGVGRGHLYESVYGYVQKETFVKFPETKLRPSEMVLLAESLLLMQRLGNEVAAITLSYNLCKYLDLKRIGNDKVFFHTFKKITKEEAKHLYNFTIERESFEDFCKDFDGIFYKHNRDECFKNIENNEIVDALIQLYHDEIDKEL
jgi:hypothetical protein